MTRLAAHAGGGESLMVLAAAMAAVAGIGRLRGRMLLGLARWMGWALVLASIAFLMGAFLVAESHGG